MSAAYFMKVDPRVKVYISTGESFQFEAVDWETGVFPPAGRQMTPFLAEELRQCIRRGVGGMTEISKEQYDELLKKKETEPDGMERPSREELQANFKLKKSPVSSNALRNAAPRVAVDMHNGAVDVSVDVPVASPPGANPVMPAPQIPKPTASKPASLPR